jgi:hypothetical protein
MATSSTFLSSKSVKRTPLVTDLWQMVMIEVWQLMRSEFTLLTVMTEVS